MVETSKSNCLVFLQEAHQEEEDDEDEDDEEDDD